MTPLRPYDVSIGCVEEYVYADRIQLEAWFPSHARRRRNKPITATDVANRLEELYGSRDEALRQLGVRPTVLPTVTDGSHCTAIEWCP